MPLVVFRGQHHYGWFEPILKENEAIFFVSLLQDDRIPLNRQHRAIELLCLKDLRSFEALLLMAIPPEGQRSI